MPAQSFERDIVNALNRYFSLSLLNAIAYRRPQFRFHSQEFDIYVDSGIKGLYMAIECKSIDPNSTESLYWTQHFGGLHQGCQLYRETDLLALTGRSGWLVVEARRGKGSRNSCYWIPWPVVHYSYMSGFPGLKGSEIVTYPSLDRQGGKYIIDDSFIEMLIRAAVKGVINK